MKHLEEQINALIQFKANTLEELQAEYSAFYNTIEGGIDKMTNSSALFTTEEISAVKKYALNLLNHHYNEHHKAIKTALRENFKLF
jgi:hypothetical protein